jgi:hypothetical protein
MIFRRRVMQTEHRSETVVRPKASSGTSVCGTMAARRQTLLLAHCKPLLYASFGLPCAQNPQAEGIAMKKLTLAVLLALATIGGMGVIALSAPPAYANCGGKHAGA